MADGEKRIKELEEITALTSNDYFVVDSSASGGETKKYKATNITDIIDNIPELVADFEPNHYYDRDALVAHEGKVYYHNAPGASYEEFPTGYQFIQIDLTGLLSRLGFGISIQHNSSFTYNKGDYCMEDYILYRCLNDNVTGAWSSSDWERASLGYDLSSIYKPRLDEHDEQIEESLALGTASGSIATFTDGSTLPMKNLEVAIEPVQDLHGYDNPWVGGSGKNKFDQTTWTYYNVSRKTNATNIPSMVTLLNSLPVGYYTISAKFKVDSVDSTEATRSYGFFVTTTGSYSVENYVRDSNPTVGHVYSSSITVNKSSADMEFTAVYIYAGRSNVTDTATIYDMQLEVGQTATTFAPYSNICPISGWDECKVSVVGKNLFDKTKATVGKFITSQGVEATHNQMAHSDYIRVKNNTTYYTNADATGMFYIIALYDENKNFMNVITVASPTSFNTSTASYVIINTAIAKTSIDDMYVIEGSEATDYEPYNGQTYNIQFTDGDNPLTVYDGTLDVVSGELTVDRAYIDMGSPTWSYTNNRFYYNPTNAKVYTQIEVANLLCSQYPNSQYNSQADNSISSYAGYIYVRADSYSGNTTAFKTAMNGVQLVYELATPITYQLTPTQVKSLLATNNVFADTGDILDATYVRNANITINDLIRRIEALEG